MKVLFYSWEFPPNGAGVGAYMGNMARALVAAGHEPVIVTGRADGLPEEAHTEYGYVYRLYDRCDAGARWLDDRVLSIARTHHVDVIEGADHLGECAGILSRPHEIPVLIKVHACQVINVLQDAHIHYPWQRVAWSLARWRARVQLRRERYVIEHADLEAVPSARLLEEMTRQGLRLPGRRAVIPNPIADPGAGDYKKAAAPVILFAGRFEFLKGIQFLPGLLREVRKRVPGVRLRIAGGDTYARWVGSLEAWLIKALGDLSPQVDFLGRLGPQELDREYRSAWVTVVPSLWDNFPTVVLESMIRGVPVVTTPHGGMPEMLAGTGAPVFDPRDPAFAEATTRLLLDEGARSSVGMLCRQRCRDCFSADAIVARYVDFLARHV